MMGADDVFETIIKELINKADSKIIDGFICMGTHLKYRTNIRENHLQN